MGSLALLTFNHVENSVEKWYNFPQIIHIYPHFIHKDKNSTDF